MWAERSLAVLKRSLSMRFKLTLITIGRGAFGAGLFTLQDQKRLSCRICSFRSIGAKEVQPCDQRKRVVTTQAAEKR